MDICTLIKANMVLVATFATLLQVVGTLLLSLFSFLGIKITSTNTPNEKVTIGGKPITHVTIVKGWLVAAKVGLLLLLFGIILSGAASIASAA